MPFVRLLPLLLALLVALSAWPAAAGTDDATPVPAVDTAPAEVPDRLLLDAPLDALPHAPFNLRLSRYSYGRDAEFDFSTLPGPLLLYVESGYLNIQVEDPALYLGARSTAAGGEQRQLIPSERVTLGAGDQLVVPGPDGLSTRNVERGPTELLIIQFSAAGSPSAPATVPDGPDVTVIGEVTFPALFGGPAEVRLQRRTVAPGAISRPRTGSAGVSSANLVTVEAGSLGVSLTTGAGEIQRGERHHAIPLGNAATPAATLAAGEGLLLASGAVAHVHNTGADPVVALDLTVTPQAPAGDGLTIAPWWDTIQVQPGGTFDFDVGVLECCYFFEPVPVDVTWSVEPADGARIDSASGVLTIDPATPHGRVYTVRAGVEDEPRELTAAVHVYTPEANPLVGRWSEQTQLGCAGGEEDPAEPIGELVFRADGTFQVTWLPFELYVDYWGVYAYDLDQGTLDLYVTGGNYMPPDVNGHGTFTLDAQDGLVLSDLWLGSPRNGAEAACGHRFL